MMIRPRHPVAAPLLALALAAAAFLPGCAELSEIDARPLTSDPRLDRPTVEELADRGYPADAPVGPDLDVVVVQGNVAVELVNKTASSYRNVHVWLNEQYVSPETDVAIGTGNRIDLRKFINALGEPFPVGTLLAPDKGRPVVLAELHDPGLGTRHRLIVQHDDDAPDPQDLRR